MSDEEIKITQWFINDINGTPSEEQLALRKVYEQMQEIKRLNNIIKEVREYLEEAKIGSNQVENAWAEDICDYVLEILDKENK